MKKTRRIILALCLLLMVTMLVTLNACVSTGDDGSQTDTTQQTDADTTGDPDTGDGSGCTHSWSAWAVVTPATCTEQGREERICAQCQTTENRAIDALSHSYGEWSVTTEATCQADGLETRVCANDATHVETRKVQKLSHTFDKEVAELVYLKSAATCTAKAVYYKSCVCGLHETGEQAATFVYGPEPTHAYGAWETTGAQSHKRVCACGAEETANHAWNDGEIKRAPTHTVAGLTTYTCTVCGATEDREIEKTTEHTFRADDFVYHDETSHKHFCACGLVEYADHAWDSGMITKPATCTEEGVKTYTCSICAGTRTEAITKLDHAYGASAPFEKQNGEIDSALHVQVCACGQQAFSAHHFDDGVITKEPGCLAGEKTYTCECGYVKTERVAATGAHRFGAWENTSAGSKHTCQDCGHTETTAHQWGAGTVAKAATCTTAGEMLYTCTGACGNATCTETYIKAIPVIPHTYDQKKTVAAALKTSATCQDHATYYYSCACGAVNKGEGSTFFEDTEGELAAHVYDQTEVDAKYLKAEATCTSLALYYNSCKCGACDKSETATFFSYGQRLAHTYKSVTTAPTCEQDGAIVYTCSGCKDSYTEKIAATGHDMAHSEQAATCEKDGYSLDYCTNEGCQKRTEVVRPAGHSFAVTRTEASCNEDGLETKTCKECGHKEETVLQKTGAHNYSVAVKVSVQSCTVDGVTSYKCAVCGETKKNGDGSEYKEIAPKTGHSENRKNVVAPTCTAAGYTQSVCSCGYIISVTPGAAANGHTWKTESEQAATCTQTGERKLTCTVCGENKTEILEKKQHQIVETTVAATCTANAYKISSCDNCEYKVTEELSGTKASHNFVNTVIAPTCEMQGYTVSECSVCQAKVTSEIKDPLGHSFNEPTCCTDATCQNAGCQAVGQKATGKHSYEMTKTETSCEKITKTYKCTTDGCTASYTEESKGAGHQTEGQTWTETAETTSSQTEGCMTVVTKSTSCSVCGERVAVVSDSYNSCQYSKQVIKNATCKAAGEVKYTCQNAGCGHFYTEATPIDAEAHAWKDATEQAYNGATTKKKVCSDCGAIKIVADASNGVTSDDLTNSDELTAGNASIQLPDSVKNEIQNSLGENGKLNVSAKPTDVDNADLPQNSVVFDLQMSNGSNPITQFVEKIKVRIPYELAEGDDPDNIAILYLDEKGNVVDTIKAVYLEIDGVGYAEFETDHFSYYTVTRLSPQQRCELYGHVETTVSQKANCLIDGYEYTLCTRCGHKGEVTVTPATGHNWNDVTVAATCTTAGHTLTTCQNCLLAYKTEIKALGHEMVATDSKEATCTTAGYTSYVCQREGCGDTHLVEVAKLGHNYGKTEVTAPTCTTAGYTTYTCKSCDHSYVADLKDATGHTIVDTVVAATCTEGGYTAHTCKSCDARFANTDEVAALGHKWDIAAPTCGKGQTCTACGLLGEAATGAHEYGTDGLCKEPTCRIECAHEWYDGDVVPATCEADGYTKQLCNHCGIEYKGAGYEDYKKVEKLGHNWKDTAHKDATCNEDGYHLSICTYCGETQREDYKKDSSRHELVTEAVAATCTTDGYRHVYCRGCKETIEKTIVKASGHKYKVEQHVDASCEADGYDLSICTLCGDRQETTTEKLAHTYGSFIKHDGEQHKRACLRCGAVEYAAHTWDEGKVTTAATHLTEGVKTYTCTVCGEIKTEKIAKDPTHSFGAWESLDDKQHQRKCACGEIEKAKHTWDEGKVTTAATHLTEGVKTYTCTVCGEIKTEKIAKDPTHTFGAWERLDDKQHQRKCACGAVEKKDHTWDDGKVTTAATHLAEGVKTYTCMVCKATRTEKIAKDPTHTFGAWEKLDDKQHQRKCACGEVEKKGHTWDDGKVTTAATHTKEGVKTYTCTVCKATRTEKIAKTTEHEFGAWIETATGFEHECPCGAKESTEHKWDKGVVTKAATHTETGIRTYTCTGCALDDCRATRTEIIEKTAEHEFGAWKSLDDKQHERKCACGAVEKKDHTWDDGKVTTAATHTKEGVKTYTCTVCKATRTEKIAKDPTHSFGAWESLDDKQHQRKCACGEVEKKDHAWDDGKVTTAATHLTEGVKTYTCTVCKATRAEKIAKDPTHSFGAWESLDDKQHERKCACGAVEKKDHTWDDGKVTTEATHTKEGVKTYTCIVCKATRTEAIAKTAEHEFGAWEKLDDKQHERKCACGEVEKKAHAWDDGKVTTEATHTKEGVKTYTCTVCKATRTEAIAKTTDHEFGDWEKLDEKQHQRKCACGEIEQKAHEWNDGVITVEPGCNSEGEKTYTCTLCGETHVEALKKTGNHTYVDGVCGDCGASEPVEGGCDHSDLNSCEIKVEFLTDIHSCEGGAIVTYVCPNCQTEVRSEYSFSHAYTSTDIQLSDYGCPCEGAIARVNTCRFCGVGEVFVEVGCEFEINGRGYVDTDTGVNHEVTVYRCFKHGWQYSVDRSYKKAESCLTEITNTYVFGAKGDFTLTLKTMEGYHSTKGEPSVYETTDTDENGKVWNAIVQIYKRTCSNCGMIVGYEEAVIRVDENGNYVWGHMIEKRPVDPYDENCTEFIIRGEAYQIAEYEQDENGKWIGVYMEGYEIEYNADGTIEAVEVYIERYDLSGETIYECGKYYVQIDGEWILVEFAECEYVAVTLNDGSVEYYKSKVTEVSYNEKGEIVESYTETWSYQTVEGNQCKLIVTHTDSTGAVKVTERFFHGKEKETYTFQNGENCDYGYLVTVSCADCGGVIREYTRYGHSYSVTQKYDLSEFGHSCGGFVYENTCSFCGQTSISVDMEGSFIGNKEPVKDDRPSKDEESGKDEGGKDESGTTHTRFTTICEKCGYVYTMETWTERIDCVTYENTIYRFGVSEDGSEMLKLISKIARGGASHRLEVEEIKSTSGTETDENGNVLYWYEVERKEYCLDCGKVVSHTLSLTKMDANGNMLYHITSNYAKDDDGKLYVSNRVTNTFAVATLDNGESFVYQTMQLTESLNIAGEVIGFKRYDYVYKEGDYCHREVHYSDDDDVNGDHSHPIGIEETHGKTEVSYSFIKDQNCANGINVNEVCTRCGEVVHSETYYHHMTEGKTIELDAKCGLSIYTYFCPCGREGGWHFQEWGCSFTSSVESILGKDGKGIGTVWTYTCEKCGFVYVDRVWNEESKENCRLVTYQIMRFGVDADGKAQYEINRTIDKGFVHNIREDVISQSQEIDPDTGWTVTSREVRFVCSACGMVESHTKTVVKTDANGNQMYRYQANYAYDADGKAYLSSDNEYEYVLRVLPSGKSKTFLAKEARNKYDVEGNKVDYSICVNEYEDGEFCFYTSTYTDSNGKSYSKRYESHGDIVISCVLMDGATDCKEGWFYRECCVVCGAISYEETRYGHAMYALEVDMSQYGAECGGYVAIFSCACGRESSVDVGGLCCSFSVKGNKYSTENGETHRVDVYTCQSCGFVYVRDMYDSIGDNCIRYSVTEYRFGVDEDGNALYTYEVRKTIGGSHASEQQIISTETTTETDESGRELTVTTTISQMVCKNCGVTLSSDYLQTVEKRDAFGNLLYRAEQTYNNNGKEPILCWEYVYTYIAVEREDGTYGTYQTLSSYTSYNYETGEPNEWRKHEYTYQSDSYCFYTETYSTSGGEFWSNIGDNHKNIVDRFTFVGEVNSCQSGVLIETICQDCQTVLNRYNDDRHQYQSNELSLDELGIACGGMLSVDECIRCGYRNASLKMLNCMFETETLINEKLDNGFTRRVTKKTCISCGFTYTEEIADEVEGCYVYRVRRYVLGIDEDGNAKMELTSKQVSYSQHTDAYDSTDPVESTEVVDGVTLIVREWEERHYCEACGHSFEHRAYVEKLNSAGRVVYRLTKEYQTRGEDEYVCREYYSKYDENGNSIATGEAYFEINASGKTYKTSEFSYEYMAVLRPDGSYGIYKTKCVATYYSADGTVSDGFVEVYLYEGNNYCVSTMTRTRHNGDVEGPFVETNHNDWQYVYTLVDGANSCYGGVLVQRVCKDCGTAFDDGIRYNHEQFTTQYTVETDCGRVTISIHRCACGFYCNESINESNCHMVSSSEKPEDGTNRTLWTSSCKVCGFTYTIETRREYSASCEVMEYRYYRIGVSADGSALHELTVAYNRGVSHNGELASNEPVEETIDGLRVLTTVSTESCTRCGKLLQVYTHVEKYDANGNLVYESDAREEPTLEVEGGLYKSSESYRAYGYATLANGTVRRYTIAEENVAYDIVGNIVNLNRYEYSYPNEGDYCYAVRTHIDTWGKESQDFVENHSEYVYRYELSEGSTTCKDGVDRVTRCRDCGKEIDRIEKWTTGHSTNRDVAIETIDLTQYGAVCGGTAYVYTCACGASQDLEVSANCHFDNRESYWYTDPLSGQSFHGIIYVCSVTHPETCGFRYLSLDYTAADALCQGTRYSIRLFGFDRETGSYLGKWESSYATGSVSHAFTSTYIDGTDPETGDRTREERYACENCGVISYRHVYTYQKTENNREYEAKIDRYYYNSEGNLQNNYLIEWDHIENMYREQSTGDTRTVRLVELYTYYNEKGEVTSWNRNDFDYSQSACRPIRTYTHSDGTIYIDTNYEEHWWDYSSAGEDWVDGRKNTCTQDGTRILHCYDCDASTKSTYGAHGGHYYNEYNNQTGMYTCYHCGLESATGGDGMIVLEDLTGRWGDGTKYIVGFLLRDNGKIEDYWISMSLVVGEGEGKQYFDLLVDYERIGTVLYVDAQAVRAFAESLGIGACEYMIEVAFIPLSDGGEYDYAITLDPHVYQKDDANCIIPENPCVDPYVTAYKCIFCNDTYKELTSAAHVSQEVQRDEMGDSGLYFTVYTCTRCDYKWFSTWTEGDSCNFSNEWTYEMIDGIQHEYTTYTCVDCGYVYQYETYRVPTEKECEFLRTQIYKWNLLEDGTFEHSVSITYKDESHNYNEELLESTVSQDENGNTVESKTYDNFCGVCGEKNFVRVVTTVMDQNGNVLERNEHQTYTNGQEYDYKDTYTYLVGPDGCLYEQTRVREEINSSGELWGWIRTYTYDFETQIRTYESVNLRYGYVQETGEEGFELKGTIGGDNDPEGELPVEPDQPDQPGQGGTTGGNIAAGDLPDFGGEEITIVRATTDDRDWRGDELSVLSAAVYERNLAIEESLNVELSYVTVDTASEFESQLNRMVLSGADDWDIVSYPNAKASYGAVSGLYADLNDSAFAPLNLDASYWNQNYIAAATVGGKLYSAVSNANLSVYDATCVVYFNETLAERHDLVDVYELVLNGEWTIERMAELARECYADLDGDGAISQGDRFGLIGDFANSASLGFLHAAGLSFTTFDGESHRYEGIDDRHFNLAEAIVELWNQDSSYKFDMTTDVYGAFAEDRALFATVSLVGIHIIQESDVSYGILPMPKWNEDQESYTSAVGNNHSIFAVPVKQSGEKYEAISAVLELAAIDAEASLYLAYYEDIMGEETGDGAKTDVFEMVMDSPTWEIFDVYATPLNNPTRKIWTDVFRTNSLDTFYSNSIAYEAQFRKQLSELINCLRAI